MATTIEQLLAQAAQCSDDADAAKLLDVMREEFTAVGVLGALDTLNEEACFDSAGILTVRFEVSRVHSDYYSTMLCPEICNGTFGVNVVTRHMRDSYDLQIQNWEKVVGLEHDVEPEPDLGQTVEAMAEKAVRQAIYQHAILLERAGLPYQQARAFCTATWWTKGA